MGAYLNHKFWAGMTTTQRAESMNAFLNKYVTKKSTLGPFLVKFETASKRLWEREPEADHSSKYKTPHLLTSLPIEKQLRDVYTNNIFDKCQGELMHCINLQSKLLSNQGSFLFLLVMLFPSTVLFRWRTTLNLKIWSVFVDKGENVTASLCADYNEKSNSLYIWEKLILWGSFGPCIEYSSFFLHYRVVVSLFFFILCYRKKQWRNKVFLSLDHLTSYTYPLASYYVPFLSGKSIVGIYLSSKS